MPEETEYQRAWRERGEMEAALRQWRNNQQSPGFIKGTAIMGGIVGGMMVGAALTHWSIHSIPVALLGALFMSLLFLAPSVLRDQERQREEALNIIRRHTL